jgi:3-oxoacyl-[acyl-carrier protein] reductase
MQEKRTIVVTGGGSGIGRAITATFARQGEQVVILGRTKEKLSRVVDEIGANVTFEVADVSQREQVEAAIASIINQFGQVSVLVNNAGFVKGITTDMPLSEAEAIWEQEPRRKSERGISDERWHRAASNATGWSHHQHQLDCGLYRR